MTEARTDRRTVGEPGRDAEDTASDENGPSPKTGRGANRWKVAFVTLLVVGVLGATTWVLLGSRLLVVRQVEVTGTQLAPRDRIVAAAGIRLGLPMVRLGTGSVRDRVEKLREVESAKVERRWPATVRIVVRERVPLVAVERAGRFYQLDRFGVAATDTPARPPRLPVLTAAAPGPSDPATLAALKVVGALPDRLGRRVTGVEAAGPEAVTLRLSGELTVVWGAPERADEKIRLVDALRKSAAGRAVRTIDVSSPDVAMTQ
ncbi:cell division protein FtsQ/DivIB [Spirillospora sp. CA-294931]|uniref:cell division protein FtsQ/DivIB n=1 Tax=Spirillospora sp. CA-294931 TaxID=3240042 RepID=UPI003D8A3030